MTVVGHPARFAVGEIAATVAGDHLFLVMVLLSAWLASSVADTRRVVRPDRLGRLGSFRDALLRAGLIEGAIRSGALVLGLLVIWGVLTGAATLADTPEVRLFPAPAPSTGTLLALILAHSAKLVLVLTVARMLVLSVGLFWPRLAPWAALGLWGIVAVSDFVADDIRAGANPMTLLNLLAHTDDTAMQVRGFGLLIVVIVALLGGARVPDALRRSPRDRRLAGLREELRVRLSTRPASLLAAAFVLVLALAAALPGPAVPFDSFAHLLYDGYGGALMQALTEAVLTVGFATSVFLRLDERRRSGWSELLSLRLGSRSALLWRSLRTELPRVPRYVAVIAALTLLGFGLGSGVLGGDLAHVGLSAYQLLVNGTLQILVYTVLIVVVCTGSTSRVWPLAALLVCLAVPMPGTVLGWLPFHRAGLAPLESGGWPWALRVSGQNLAALLTLILIGTGITRFLDHRTRVPRRTP